MENLNTSAPSSPPSSLPATNCNNNNSNFFFFSAPSSPTAARLYAEFTHNPSLKNADPLASYSVPFDWEDSPGIPKNRVRAGENNESNDFEFDFSGQSERGSVSLSAEELFDGGKIKPLKPPPRLQVVDHIRNRSEKELSDSVRFRTAHSSPRSPMSNIFFPSPRRKQNCIVDDPFTRALEEARKSRGSEYQVAHKKTRSSSTFRVADILSDEENLYNTAAAKKPSLWGLFSIPKAYRKWSIRDLFRSASEEREKEKRTVIDDSDVWSSSNTDEVRNSSFRSTEGSESSVGSSRRWRRRNGMPVSVHELHYKVSREVSEESRKKTFLPYKQRLLSLFRFRA